MKEVLFQIFGTYTPVTYTVTQELSDGSVDYYTVVADGLAGVDWPYILGILLFGIMLTGCLRILINILRR